MANRERGRDIPRADENDSPDAEEKARHDRDKDSDATSDPGMGMDDDTIEER